MSERKFDYQQISSICKNMATTTDNIANTLDDIDKKYHEYVAKQPDCALYGELASQLLLDWENTSSDFKNFVTNFENWSSVVVQAGGNYQQFENDIAGFMQANPLGSESNGMTSNFIDTSYYANAHSLEDIQALDVGYLFDLSELTGAEYIDTGMVKYESTNKAFRIIGDLATCASAAILGVSWIKYARALRFASTATKIADARQVANAIGEGEDVAKAVQTASRTALGTRLKDASSILSRNTTFVEKFARTGLGSKLITNPLGFKVIQAADKAALISYYSSQTGKTATGVGAMLNYAHKGISGVTTFGRYLGYGAQATNSMRLVYTASHATGTDVGNVYEMNGETYMFAGNANGHNIYSDDNGNLLYRGSDGSLINVVNESGTNVTLDNLDDNATIVVGGINVQTDSVTGDFDVRDLESEAKRYSNVVTGLNPGTSSNPSYGQTGATTHSYTVGSPTVEHHDSSSTPASSNTTNRSLALGDQNPPASSGGDTVPQQDGAPLEDYFVSEIPDEVRQYCVENGVSPSDLNREQWIELGYDRDDYIKEA